MRNSFADFLLLSLSFAQAIPSGNCNIACLTPTFSDLLLTAKKINLTPIRNCLSLRGF